MTPSRSPAKVPLTEIRSSGRPVYLVDGWSDRNSECAFCYVEQDMFSNANYTLVTRAALRLPICPGCLKQLASEAEKAARK